MPKFIVEGIYETEQQITADVVVAETTEEAEDKVTAVREKHGECVGDPWSHNGTIPVEDELANLQRIAAESDEKTESDWNTLKRESLGLLNCTRCGKLIHKSEDCGGDDPLCEECSETVDEELEKLAAAEGAEDVEPRVASDALSAWNDKFADLFNGGISDDQIGDFFTAEQCENFLRDYASVLRKQLQPK